MQMTAEMSLYPLANDYIPAIKAFIAELSTRPGLQVVTNRLSTQVTGSFEAVTRAIEHCMRETMSGPGRAVLVVKYLNTGLPIDTPPDLD